MSEGFKKIEHRVWVPPAFYEGIEGGQKIAIVGHSHHGDEADGSGKTTDTMQKVISGEWNLSFFSAIRDYFGFKTNAEFWTKVMFFNYAPSFIGTHDQRFADFRDPAEVVRAKARFNRELEKHHPDKVLIFSRKARWSLPELKSIPYDAPIRDARRAELGGSNGMIDIFLLRHPQGAPKTAMIATVAAILAEKTLRRGDVTNET